MWYVPQPGSRCFACSCCLLKEGPAQRTWLPIWVILLFIEWMIVSYEHLIQVQHLTHIIINVEKWFPKFMKWYNIGDKKTGFEVIVCINTNQPRIWFQVFAILHVRMDGREHWAQNKEEESKNQFMARIIGSFIEAKEKANFSCCVYPKKIPPTIIPSKWTFLEALLSE